MSCNTDYENRIKELEQQLEIAEMEVKNLKISVRSETLKVKIVSEYSNFGLWEYDIADDICYQYKKLNGIYESNLDPIIHFRDTILSWGSVFVDDIPVFHSFCDAMERGDKDIRYDVRVINDFSEIAWFRYEGRTIYDDNGVPVRVVGRTLDVTEEKGGTGVDTDERRDQLTGALALDNFIDTVTERAAEKNEKSSALIVVCIDDFEEISAIPDVDIPHIQRTLAKVLESQSAVEQGSAFARVKDGVFAFYIRFSDIPHLNTIASRIIFRFHDFQFRNTISGKHITVSAGISLFRPRMDYDRIYKEAMTACKSVQHKGGKGFVQYSASMPIDMSDDFDEAAEKLRDIAGAVGAEKIYQCVNIALTDKTAAYSALKKAMELAGEYARASRMIIRHYGRKGEEVYLPWAADGSTEYNPGMPDIIPARGVEAFLETLKNNKRIFVTTDSTEYQHYGISFENGAHCALCYSVMYEGRVVGSFTIVSDMPMVWQNSDYVVFDMLATTLETLFGRYYYDVSFNRRMSFSSAVINDLSIEGFTIVPDTFEVDYIGGNASHTYGLKQGDVCYKKIRGLDEPCQDCPVHQLKAGQMRASTAYYRQSDGRWIDIAASNLENENGEARYVVSSADITNCISKVQSRDTLTGLMGFDNFAVDAMRMTAGSADHGYIVVINIANFRRFNEENGFENGNTVLISAADILKSALQENELLCRSEGARFVALYRNTNKNDLLTRLNQMFQSIQRTVSEKTGFQIHIIAGVYELAMETLGIMGALDRAILAQKNVKNKAYYVSNMISFYDQSLADALKDRRFIEMNMVEALKNNEFKVFYQPKVCTETGKIVGAEALVRWIRPDGEIISPAKFVPVFEQNGFITDMDFAVYRRAIADIKRWMREGKDIPLISLNVSRHHLRDDSFPDKFCALVDNIGVPHEMLELEITESMLSENLARLLDIMTMLKDQGFRISVDDFGSGYSSLNLITLLPFDTLKIDGGFFLKNDLTEKNKAVITSVVELAKHLNLSTVSEGVETDEQVSFLKELGCDIIQGYYYYKPLPATEFEVLMEMTK